MSKCALYRKMHLLQTERDTGREGQTGRDRDRETDPARETKGEKERRRRDG